MKIWNQSKLQDIKPIPDNTGYREEEIPILIIFKTSLGWMGALSSSRGLRKIVLPCKSTDDVSKQINGNYKLARSENSSCLGDLPRRLKDYISGYKVVFVNKLDLMGATAFQLRVWKATRFIPYGKNVSYQWMAKEIGCDKGQRAVGQALGKNPVPIFIPCHRVISSHGRIGGFSSGIEMKKHLLKLEGITIE